MNRGRSGHCRHREGGRAQSDRGRHEAMRDISDTEQLPRHRRQNEKRDEKARPTVGDERARKRALGLIQIHAWVKPEKKSEALYEEAEIDYAVDID